MSRTYVGGSSAPIAEPLPTASLARVLLHLVPGASFTYDNEDYATLVWGGPGNAPTLAQVNAARDTATAALRAPINNRATLLARALAALAANQGFRTENDAFLALGAAPTSVQVRDHTIRMARHSNAYSRQLDALIRLYTGSLDATD